MNTKPDPILQEVWHIKDAAAARHAGDVRATAAELRQQQQTSGRKVVSLPPRRIKPVVAPR